MNKIVKGALGIVLVGAIGTALVFMVSGDARKKAQIAALDKIGDVAAKRIAENPDAEGSVAAEFINIPIKAREIAPGVFQATGVGNAQIISTPEGDVMFDTGLSTQVPKQMKALKAAIPDLDLSHIIVSHSHADHSGGVKFWSGDGVEIVAHAEFEEEQRYLTELQSYFWGRNRTLFPFMPEEPPKLGLIAYGGIEPTLTVTNGAPMRFSQGGVDFEILALPGAEGADNIVLWLPQQKILLSGDFFGPLFPQFPNVFTMRGEKIRKPVEYIRSLETIIALGPEMVVPSHRDPVTDPEFIMAGLVKMRDATRYVHDAVIEGMNAGKTVEQLMAEVTLPEELTLTQEHGRVSWAVKSIWEYYATWFHFEDTTELYAVPASAVSSDIVSLAGADALAAKAKEHVEAGRPLEALHLAKIILESDTAHKPALEARREALQLLLTDAENGLRNSYEIYWLKYRIRDVQARLAEISTSQ